MEDKFEKRKNCLYCSKEMDAKYRSKKFCSNKCRVYYGREVARQTFGISKVGEVIINDNPTIPDSVVTKRKQHNHSLTLTVQPIIPKKTSSDTEPAEGTNRFFLKYGAFTHEEAKKLK